MLRNLINLGLIASTVFASPLLYPRQASNTATTGASNTACALVAEASARFLKEYPGYKSVVTTRKLAVDCLDSIPLVKDDALRLVRSLKLYLEFQSDKEYRKVPPAGFVNPPYDLDQAFNQIQTNVEKGAYTSETEFQRDIYFALSATFDGHTYLNTDILTGVFSFQLSDFYGLSSLSMDGVADPKIYFTEHIFNYDNKTNSYFPLGNASALPVVKIDGVDAAEYVEINSLLTRSQDPDARYQRQFFSISSPPKRGPWGNFMMTRIPPTKDTITFEFSDGTKTEIYWLASIKQDFEGVTNGLTAYQKFAPFASPQSETIAASPSESSTAPSSTATSPKKVPTAVPYFPKPVIKSADNTVAGYYLTTAGFEDVAVLQILSFSPSGELEEFSGVVADFLAGAKAAGKTKLILDVQQNGGGYIDLGTDIISQILPNIPPNASGNMRRSAGMDIIVSAASTEVNALAFNETAKNFQAMDNAPFSYQYDINPDGTNINSVDELLNHGIDLNGQKFTSFFQTNYSDPLASQYTGFSITQTDKSLSPPFAPENIILLTDGVCASSCAVFSEHLKNKAGINQILVGGRPKHGPVQAVGGIKGSQVFNGYSLDYMADIFWNGTEAELASIKGTPWEHFNKYPLGRTADAAWAMDPAAGVTGAGVNGRNSFRLGESSNTPLQYIYDAADCRLWWTPEMVTDPMALWARVSEVAFKSRTGTKYTSKYCTAGSTGHSTSVSGGWQKGSLGDQSQGKVEASSPVFKKAPWNLGTSKVKFHWDTAVDASSFGEVCPGYGGSNWAVQMLCKVYTSYKSS